MKVKGLTDKISDHFTNIIQLSDYAIDGHYKFNAYVTIKDGNVSFQVAQLSSLNGWMTLDDYPRTLPKEENNQLLECKAFLGEKDES